MQEENSSEKSNIAKKIADKYQRAIQDMVDRQLKSLANSHEVNK